MLHFDLIVPNCFKLSDLGLSCYSFIPVLRLHIFYSILLFVARSSKSVCTRQLCASVSRQLVGWQVVWISGDSLTHP